MARKPVKVVYSMDAEFTLRQLDPGNPCQDDMASGAAINLKTAEDWQG